MKKYLHALKKFVLQEHAKGWLRLLAPVILGVMFIWLVIHIMNFGGPRESLVAKSETEILRIALKNATPLAGKSRSNLVIISAVDSDLEAIQSTKTNSLLDADIEEYASVLEHVALQNPRWIVLTWLSHAQPLTPEHLRPITSTIDRLKIRDKVTIAVNFVGSNWLESDFSRQYNVVEARDCYHEVNIHCTVSKDWIWMPQQVMNRFFTEPKQWLVSTNLPHHLPNVALNLPDVSSLTKFSFLDTRAPVLANIPDGAVVFIGNNTTQDVTFRNNKEVLQRTYIAASKSRRTLQDDGIPWHEFWAAMTAMFIDSSTLKIGPSWLEAILCSLGAALVLTLGLRKIGPSTILAFVSLIAALLLFNIFSVRYAAFYMPITSTIITCFAALAATVFIRLAINNYRKQRLLAAENNASELGDVKNNFLQMISHNLNTPIAQLRGLLEILASEAGGISALDRALLLTDYVRITAKAALGTSSLGERRRSPQSRNIRDALNELIDDESSFFRRIGTEIDVNWSTAPEDVYLLQQPLLSDPGLLTNALFFSALLILPEDKESRLSVHVSFAKTSTEGRKSVVIDLTSTPLNELIIHQESLDFTKETLRRYLDGASQLGVLRVKINNHHAQLIVADII